MLLKGSKIGANKEEIVIPRGDTVHVFVAEAIKDRAVFEKMCPEPTPPEIMKPGGIRAPNFDDARYKSAVEKRNELLINWMIIESLKATPELVWEKVNPNNPDTWHLFREEFAEAGLNEFEINRIIQGVLIANSLDDRKIEAARQKFFSKRASDNPETVPA